MPSGISIGSVLLGAAGSSILGSMFADGGGQAPQQQAAPVVAPVTAMPTPGDAVTAASKKKSLAEQIARRGRASTILTDQGATDTLG